MRTILSRLTLFLFVLILGAAPVYAQRGHGHNKPPKPPASKPNTPPSKPNASPNTPKGPMTPQEHLNAQPKLVANLQKLNPAIPVIPAADGFTNLGHFVAAWHVSHNLDIPFATLKAKVTGPNAESLGQAIHELKPPVNAQAEVERAEAQARHDLKSNGEKEK